MKKEIEKEVPSSFAEGAISILTVLTSGSREVKEVFLSDFKKIKTDRKISRIKRLCDDKNIPFHKCSEDFILKNTIGSTHGGIIADVSERNYFSIEEAFSKDDGFVCLIDGIEDPYNFAYSVRSLYAAGLDWLILSDRNWMSAAGVCIKGSAGATELVNCAIYKDKEELIRIAKERNYTIVCADEKTDTLHTAPVFKKPVFLIVGGEKRGISKDFLQSADTIVKIDYGRDFGMSLTSASATSILAFEVLRQNKQ
ncbi:MAG: RNA methyltransferase [Ruminococcaceae bacterium]|nr:RNA methyltransferase [Oscillospiraceae bacterium]